LALSPEEQYILIAFFTIVGLLVMYFELRVMRGRSKEARKVAVVRDEAYNSILTMRSVQNSLRNQGRNTGRASDLIERADQARRRGDYVACMDYCDKAREEITKPSTAPQVAKPAQASSIQAGLDEIDEEMFDEPAPASYPDSYKGEKLTSEKDAHYMSAKFEMSAAKTDISKASKRGVDTSAAQQILAEAEDAFSAGRYDRALSNALKARRSVGDSEAVETIPLKPPRREEKAEDMSEAAGPTGSGISCSKCGAEVEPGDAFCAICGERIERDLKCQSCGAKSSPSDKFCRKCGSRLG